MFWLTIFYFIAIASGENKRTNIVIFIVDDLGVGDVGCFGNTTLHTPNIDRLCREGVKLEQDKSAAPSCTPSRTALLTGRYAIRSGMVAPSDRLPPVVVWSSASAGLPKDSRSFASVIREANYTNGYFGKWHLGIHCEGKDFCHFPLSHGFQYYYGMPLSNLAQCSHDLLKQSETIRDPQWLPLENRYFPQYLITSLLLLFCFPKSTLRKCLQAMLVAYTLLWFLHILHLLVDQRQQCILLRNLEVIQQPVDLENITQSVTNEATRFIERTYRQPFMAVVAYHKVHVALKTAAKFRGSSSGHGVYGNSVKEVDWSVGVILDKLKQLGVERGTFVYFTSDHGPALYLGKNGGYAGRLRGGKGTNWEGGIRVPTIVKWPNRLPKGVVYKGVTSGLDLFPTVAHVAGVSIKDMQLDGRNIIPEILDNSTTPQDRFLFHYRNTHVEAVTYGYNGNIWKAHFQGVIDPTVKVSKMVSEVYPKPLLFELLTNSSEREPIDPDLKVYSETMLKITGALQNHGNSVVPVPYQLSAGKNKFSFERQMCCNFPLCSC